MENHSNINNQFIPYNLALELKGLGFKNNWNFKEYDTMGYLQHTGLLDSHKLEAIDAPLWQQGINFLLNKLNGHYCITFYKDETGYITDNRVDYLEYDFENFTECLKKLIEIVKNDK